MNGIEIVSASAGSGKTHRLVEVLEHAVTQGGVRPEAVIATTFTVKAAAELRERVRLRLLENGLVSEAQRLALARIGTVNSVCGSLVTDYAFELGLSPELRVLDEEGAEEAFERTLSARADVSRDAEGEAGAGSEAAVALQELATRMPGLDWV
ncbi:MAG: UvrD-helicase domain-containing protein, partial [bacterium]